MQLSNLQGKISYQKVKSLYKENPVISASTEVVLTVFAVSFMLALALRPTLKIVAELRRKIEDQTEVNQKLNAKIKALQLAQESLTENVDILDLYETTVPDGADLASVSKRLEILAQESDVIIDVFKVEAVSLLGNSLSLDKKAARVDNELDEGEMVTLPIRITVEGDFAAIEEFVSELEKMDRLLRINSFSMEKEARTSRERGNYLSANIEGEVYYKFVEDF